MEKEMATHSSILAWRIPWTEEPGGLQSMGSQRVRRDWRLTHIPTLTWGISNFPLKVRKKKMELSDFNLKKITWPSNAYTTKFRLLLWLSFFNINEIYTVLTLSLGNELMNDFLSCFLYYACIAFHFWIFLLWSIIIS